jgi:hypothetical protein
MSDAAREARLRLEIDARVEGWLAYLAAELQADNWPPAVIAQAVAAVRPVVRAGYECVLPAPAPAVGADDLPRQLH